MGPCLRQCSLATHLGRVSWQCFPGSIDNTPIALVEKTLTLDQDTLVFTFSISSGTEIVFWNYVTFPAQVSSWHFSNLQLGALLLQLMLCRICNNERTRRDWSESQWKANRCIVSDVIGCKRCRRNVASNPLFHLHTRHELVLILGHILRVYRPFERSIKSLVDSWMKEYDADQRKNLSYRGAIRIQGK